MKIRKPKLGGRYVAWARGAFTQRGTKLPAVIKPTGNLPVARKNV